MENILFILTYIAVASPAISGALEARKNEMDIVGAFFIFSLRLLSVRFKITLPKP
jgi:uncharacterized membrane protein YeiH